jgi:hypothetical protein
MIDNILPVCEPQTITDSTGRRNDRGSVGPRPKPTARSGRWAREPQRRGER